MNNDEVIIMPTPDEEPQTALKTASLHKKAFGYNVDRILNEELPLLNKAHAQKYVDNLQNRWEFQTANDEGRYKVDHRDWEAVMKEIKSRFWHVNIPLWETSKAFQVYDQYPEFPGRRVK